MTDCDHEQPTSWGPDCETCERARYKGPTYPTRTRDLERNEWRTVRLGKLVVGMFCVWMLAIIVNVAWELWKL